MFEAKKVSITHVPCDLGKPDEVERAATEVLRFTGALAPGRVWLLNNSGFGGYGHFPEPNLAHTLAMVDVNVRGAVHLTGLLLPEWKRRGGTIGNVASTAAFQPTPYMAVYGGTKAFLLHWSLALSQELRRDGVRVVGICPGPTSTEFYRTAGFDEPVLEKWMGQEPEEVAAAIVRAMAGKRTMVITGALNKGMMFVSTKIPKRLGARVAAVFLRKYGDRK